MQRVINFSGGKTSAYMTIRYYRQGDIVLFCDTGREHAKTYKFINDFEAFEGIPVTRTAYIGGFEGMLDSEKRKAIPNNFKRFCTKKLKIQQARRKLREMGVKSYINMIGFRHDEPLRVARHTDRFKSVKTIFPLYADRVNKDMVNEYWRNKPYTLEIPSLLGNCTLCFMKGKNAIISIMSVYPELADEWIQDEKRDKKGNTYLKGISMETMLKIAKNSMFKDYDLNEIKPAFDCACTA